MPKGKAEKIDLSHLTFEEAVKQAWEAEAPPKKKDGTASEQAEQQQERQIREGQENTG